nr:MAG TPA: hypothetical protein [Caudoviricetes sp.]
MEHFNPRTREGCDDIFGVSTDYLLDFNPRTREGCDEARLLVSTANADFNPRTREGCDPHCASIIPKSKLFQSTHPRGVRPSS